MAITLEEINRKFWQRFTPEERLKGLPAEERLKGLDAREIINAVLNSEEFQHLSPDEIAKLVRELAEKSKRT